MENKKAQQTSFDFESANNTNSDNCKCAGDSSSPSVDFSFKRRLDEKEGESEYKLYEDILSLVKHLY